MMDIFHKSKERLQKSIKEIGVKETFKKGLSGLLFELLLQEMSNRRLDKSFRKCYYSPFFREIDFHALNLEGSGGLWLNPLDEGFSKEFFLYGFREPLNTYFIYHNVRGHKVLDIGSNLGYFPIIELNAGAKQVIAMEPVPMTFRFLKRNLAPYNSKVVIINAAISNRNGNLELFIPRKFNLASAIHTTDSIFKRIQCPAYSLSTIAEQYDFDTLRMDIEGFEYEVLIEGIPENIKYIFMELHDSLGLKKTQRLLLFLEKQGFIAKYSIREIPLKFYPFIKNLNLQNAFSILRTFNQTTVESNIMLSEIAQMQLHLRHLILERI